MIRSLITAEAVMGALRRTAGIVRRTPVDFSATFSAMTDCQVYLKLENLQKTGSFKIRGALNKISLLAEGKRPAGVVAASAGNHAQGVAYAAARVQIPCVIVMPEGAPLSKVAAAEGYGAKVLLAGADYDSAYQRAQELASQTGAVLVHAFDDEEVIAGQATLGIELAEDLRFADAVLVPAGGGGLLAGVSFILKERLPRIKVIGVQAQGASSLVRSFYTGQLVEEAGSGTFADGIAVKRPGEKTFAIIQKYVDEMVAVSDEQIAGAVLYLLERSKVVAEGAGACALAALLCGRVRLKKGSVAAVIISGGNIDTNALSVIIERGLIQSGRRAHISATISDRPGSLSKLLLAIASARANIISVNHDRTLTGIPWQSAVVEVVLETAGPEHMKEVVSRLTKAGFQITHREKTLY